jgi:nitrogen fixation protein FixH
MTATQSKSFNPWPYAIVGYFIVFGSAIAIFVTWAVHQRMDLVQKDYYESEMVFQKRIDAVNRTAAIKKEIFVRYERHRISVILPAKGGNISGSIHLYRPSDARLDQNFPIKLDGEGSQKIPAESLTPGLWKVRVSWSANGEDYYYDNSLVVGTEF